MKNLTLLTCLTTLVCVAVCSVTRAQSVIRTAAHGSRTTLVENYVEKSNDYTLASSERTLYLDSALSLMPQSASLWQQHAVPLLKQKKYDLAFSDLDSAVKYSPRTYLEYRAFAKCIFLKNYRSALMDFMAVLRFNKRPTSIDHPYNYYIGLCYLQMNRFDSAEVVLSRCIGEENGKGAGCQEWFYVGIANMENKKYSKAIESFQKCLQLSNRFSDAQYYLSLCLVKYKRYKAAYDLAKLALGNFRNGYTVEDSYSDFEYYPYQINRDLLNQFLTKLKIEYSVADAKEDLPIH